MKYYTKTKFDAKKVGDVLGGPDAWKDVDKTMAPCGECGHQYAYFIQFQTRSADEPMTIFFKCGNCGKTWKED